MIVHQLTAIGPVDMRHMERDFAPTNRLRTEGTDYLLSAGQAVGVRRFVAQGVAGFGAYARAGGPIKSEEDPLDATLTPYRGRFILHGETADVREGEFTGDLIAIQFPDKTAANDWYRSAAYRKIAPLRAENSDGWLILIEGVAYDHHATDILTAAPTGA
ncbi:MAG: DUF1330 domain-containing protein [Solirubrobacteraceae bacterium]